MTTTPKPRIFKTLFTAVMALALLAGATVADAQDREGRWEFSLGTFYQLGTSIESEGGSTDTDNDFGFELGTSYNFTDNVAVNLGLQWAGVGYDATGYDDDGARPVRARAGPAEVSRQPGK